MMSNLAIEVQNGDIPTIRQALRNLVDASYIDTSIGARWKETGPRYCAYCSAIWGTSSVRHTALCVVGRAEKALVADVPEGA